LTKSEQLSRAATWADSLARDIQCSCPPVDLFAVARRCGIKLLAVRPIIPKALLIPVIGGFEAYLQDPSRADLDLTGAEPADLLSPRQRFSLAHEIAHTRFYKTVKDQMPTPDGSVKNGLDLEDICDQTAGLILVPTILLKKEISNPANIDAAFVSSVALKFRTSAEVTIRRLAAVEASNLFERCILLVRSQDGDAQIRASYFGDGLLPLLPRPKIYARLTEWIPDIPGVAINGREHSDSTIARKGRDITLTKTELSGSGEFLLQIQATRETPARK
jgi:hypothetical protein